MVLGPSAECFVLGEQQRLAAELRARLDALYATRYCSAPVYNIEEAARCAYLDRASAPAAARSMLRAQLGEDEAHRSIVLARR